MFTLPPPSFWLAEQLSLHTLCQANLYVSLCTAAAAAAKNQLKLQRRNHLITKQPLRSLFQFPSFAFPPLWRVYSCVDLCAPPRGQC